MKERGLLWVILFSLVLSGLGTSGLSQTSAPALEHLLAALQRKYSRLRSLAADFVQVYQAAGSPARREEGVVLFARPRRMRWHYRHPEEKFFISDGEQVFLYVPAERQVIRARLREAEDIRAAFAFLLGKTDLRRAFSRIERVTSVPPLHPGGLILRFIPKDARLGFSELLAEIDPQSLHLRSLSIRELDGARSSFLFSNIRENVPVSPADFVLSIPPGVQVLEAR